MAMQIPQMAKDSLEDQLLSAILHNDTASIAGILRQGANINFICLSGKTLLGLAAEMGNISILRTLLNVNNSSGENTLDESCKNESEIKLSIKSSRQRNSKDTAPEDNLDKRLDENHSYSSNNLKCFQNRGLQSKLQFELPVLKLNKSDEFSQTVNDPSDSNSSNSACQNSGYFVVIHNEGDSSVVQSLERSESPRTLDENWNRNGGTFPFCALNDMRTPDGMDKLEWDEEVKDVGELNDEEDSLSSQYRWYADILDKTSSLLIQPPQCRDLNHQDLYGRSALHYAAEHGSVEGVQLLLSAGCRVDVADFDNLTALHLAAACDQAEVMKALISAGADVNAESGDRNTALHYAASRGAIETSRLLLSAGAKVDPMEANDRTPLMLAVCRQHEHIVDLLIRNGARVNVEEVHGHTPLCEAVWKKAVPIVQLLLAAGAKITQSHMLLHFAILHRHYEMAELLVKAGSIVNLRDDNGNPPLISAARAGHCQLAELLLNNGALANYPSSITGSTALHEAVEYLQQCEYNKFEQLFYVLRAHGASLNTQACMLGDTPLYRAVLLEKYQAAMLLLRHGTNLKLHSGCPLYMDILYIAQKRNRFPLMRMIVCAGYNLAQAPYLTPPHPAHDPTGTLDWLRTMRCNPMRLADLCRIRIRDELGESVYERISTSRLPYMIKKFLLLEDIET